jgi:hypothetical protein
MISGLPSLAIDTLCSCGRATGYRVPEEPSPNTLLAVAQCVAKVPGPVLPAGQSRQPPGMAADLEEDCNASCLVHGDANHPAIF